MFNTLSQLYGQLQSTELVSRITAVPFMSEKMIANFAVGAKECYMCGSYDMADRPCSSFGAFGHRAEIRPCTNLTWHGKEIYPSRYYSDDDGFYCVKVSII